jgi:signal transduction histidine kinase
MAGRPRELLAAALRAEPRRAPSGWGLALDAAVAVAAAVFAIVEVLDRRGLLIVVKGSAVWPVAAHAGPLVIVAAALTALPLAARRLYPISAMLAIIAAISWIKFSDPGILGGRLVLPDRPLPAALARLPGHVAVIASDVPVPSIAFATAVLAAYSAVAHSRYRYLAIGVVAAVALGVTAAFGSTLPKFPERLTALLAITPAVAAALGIRGLRRRLSDSAARLRRATEEYEAATVRAIEAERARIAGELHDVVTHNVSVMVVQAGAARLAMASSPGEATEALRAVEATGRTAIAELRNLLGVLSPPADEVALRPQPGLGELEELISRLSAAGLSVDLLVQGTPRPLPPGADLAAYRVVQEALTNVLRHAGRAATSVIVHWGEKLEITVSNSDGPVLLASTAGGSGRSPLRAGLAGGFGGSSPLAGTAGGSGGSSPRASTAGGFGGSSPRASTAGGAWRSARRDNTEPGRGLLGLRERLSLYGGELDAGPRPGGGWQVHAVMPIGATA